MHCSPPDSSVHGILQARIQEWVAISFSRRSSSPRDWACASCVSCMAGRLFTTEPPGKPVSMHPWLLLSTYSMSFGQLMWRANLLEKTLMRERLRAGEEGDNRGWDGWMASLTWWTCVWASSRRWWRTGKPGPLQFTGSQRVGHNWVTEKHNSMWYCTTSVISLIYLNLP